MAQHAQLKIDSGIDVYFCNPHSPWQRPSNENTNGLLHQYFPNEYSQTAATSLHPDAELCCEAIKIATAVRGGKAMINNVVFHSDRGFTYTADAFTRLCHRGVRQSIGKVGSCFDNARAEAFFSSLEWEVLSRHEFSSTRQARAVVMDRCYGFYNHDRRHTAAERMSPINYENTTVDHRWQQHRETLHDLREPQNTTPPSSASPDAAATSCSPCSQTASTTRHEHPPRLDKNYRDTPRRSAIVTFATPSAAYSNTPARNTSRCAAVVERATSSNTTR